MRVKKSLSKRSTCNITTKNWNPIKTIFTNQSKVSISIYFRKQDNSIQLSNSSLDKVLINNGYDFMGIKSGNPKELSLTKNIIKEFKENTNFFNKDKNILKSLIKFIEILGFHQKSSNITTIKKYNSCKHLY